MAWLQQRWRGRRQALPSSRPSFRGLISRAFEQVLEEGTLWHLIVATSRTAFLPRSCSPVSPDRRRRPRRPCCASPIWPSRKSLDPHKTQLTPENNITPNLFEGLVVR